MTDDGEVRGIGGRWLVMVECKPWPRQRQLGSVVGGLKL